MHSRESRDINYLWKAVESHLIWFVHLRRPLEAPVRKVYQMVDSPIVRGRGRPKKIVGPIKKDLELNVIF